MTNSPVSAYAEAFVARTKEMGIQWKTLPDVQDPAHPDRPLTIYWRPLTVEEQSMVLAISERPGNDAVTVKVDLLIRKALRLESGNPLDPADPDNQFAQMFSRADKPVLLAKAFQGLIAQVTDLMMDDKGKSDADLVEEAEGN